MYLCIWAKYLVFHHSIWSISYVKYFSCYLHIYSGKWIFFSNPTCVFLYLFQVNQKKCQLRKLEKAIRDTKNMEERYWLLYLWSSFWMCMYKLLWWLTSRLGLQEPGATCNEQTSRDGIQKTAGSWIFIDLHYCFYFY